MVTVIPSTARGPKLQSAPAPSSLLSSCLAYPLTHLPTSSQHLLQNQPAIHPGKLLVHLGGRRSARNLVFFDLEIGQRIDAAVQKLPQSLLQRHACRAEVEQRRELQNESQVGKLLIGDQRARLLCLTEVERR